MLSLYLLSFVFSLIFLQYLWSRRKFYMLSWKLPGPVSYPIIGNGLAYRNPDNILKVVQERRNYFQCTHRFWIGPQFFVHIYDPEDIEKVLTSTDCLNKIDLYKVVKTFCGDAIFASEKERWMRNRKLINPSFNHNVLVSLFPIFNSQLNALVGKLGNMVGKGKFCVTDSVMRCNLDIACQTTMGVNINTLNMKNEDIFDAFKKGKYIIGKRFTLWFQFDVLFRFIGPYKMQEDARRVIRELIEKLIKSKCSAENNNKIVISKKEEYDGIKKEDNIFIDHAIKLVKEQKFEWSDVYNESNFIALAAFDTTAVTVTYIIQCLAMFPECQQKVIEEIQNIFPNEHFDVTHEDTKNMHYCELVINETLRLFPPVPILARKTTNDFHLKDDIVIPKGTALEISVLGMHRDPKIWGPTAHTFDPNRFIRSEIAKIHSYAYLPFSKGPRNCIGWRYAIYSLKVFMAKIFRKYRFTTNQKLDDFNFRMEVTLTPLQLPIVEVHRI